MAKTARKKRPGKTPVVIGFVVKKRWKDEHDKVREKVVSRSMAMRSAAETSRDLAAKNDSTNPAENEREVEFFVTDDRGFDDLPGGV